MISEHLISSELRLPFQAFCFEIQMPSSGHWFEGTQRPPWASQVLLVVKSRSLMQETWVQSLSQEDTLENGYPLQYSCLKSPMNRGAWWATVYGVAIVRHNWSDLAWMPERLFSALDRSIELAQKTPTSCGRLGDFGRPESEGLTWHSTKVQNPCDTFMCLGSKTMYFQLDQIPSQLNPSLHWLFSVLSHVSCTSTDCIHVLLPV